MYVEIVDVSNHVADLETVNLQIWNAHKVFVVWKKAVEANSLIVLVEMNIVKMGM